MKLVVSEFFSQAQNESQDMFNSEENEFIDNEDTKEVMSTDFYGMHEDENSVVIKVTVEDNLAHTCGNSDDSGVVVGEQHRKALNTNTCFV